MQEVIQKVMAAEAEAKRVAQAARVEAAELVNNARLQAVQIKVQAKCEAQKDAEQILSAAELEAMREKSEQLAGAAQEIESAIRLDSTKAEELVSAAVDLICGYPQRIEKAP